jgi:RNA polymerase sigma-70 factor (ECF subfamily)
LYLHNKRRKKKLTSLDEEMRDTLARPDKVSEDRSELDEVLKAVQLLPEIDRIVLTMRAEDELSYEEIARSTGLPVSTVKIKVFRSRAKIHSILTTQRGETI